MQDISDNRYTIGIEDSDYQVPVGGRPANVPAAFIRQPFFFNIDKMVQCTTDGVTDDDAEEVARAFLSEYILT